MPEPDMLTRIATNPLSFIFGCIVWVPLGIILITLIRSMVSGDIDGLVGFVACMVLLGLGAVAASPPADWLSPLIFGVVVMSAIGFPVASNWHGRQACRAMDGTALRDTMVRLRLNPNDFLALSRASDLLKELELMGYSITFLDRAVQTAPPSLITTERNKLRSLMMFYPPHTWRAVTCKCGATPEFTDLFCPKCQRDYLSESALVGTLEHHGTKWLVAGWGTGFLVLVGIVALSAYGGYVVLIGVPILLVLGILVVVRTVRPSGGVT